MKNNIANYTTTLKGKTLLVINTGSIKKKFVFQKLKKLGLTVVVLHKEKNWAAPHVDHWILSDTNNYKESVEAVKLFLANNPRVKIDGALTFWEESVLLCSKITDTFNLIGIPFSVAKHARNKFLFREFCEKQDIRAPKHILIQKKEDLRKIHETLHYPLVIKPIYGSSSAFVVKIENDQELYDTYEYIQRNITSHPDSAEWDAFEVLVEEYIDGDEVDIDLLIQNGKVKFHSISDNYQTNEPFFVETGQSIPSSLPEKNQMELLDLAEETLEKMGVQNGCVHFEAKSTKRGPVPIEANLRMGGDEVYSFVRGAWGVDLIEYSVKIALGSFIPNIKRPVNPKKYITGQYFLSNESGVLVTSDINTKIKKEDYLEELHFYKQIGDPVLVPPEGYEYLGWITVNGDNLLDSQDNLKEAMKYISYSVAKFDTASSLGKTSRKNRFSSAVLNKDLLLRSVKLQHIKRINRANQQRLHIGIMGNNANGSGLHKEDVIDKVIQQALVSRGYHISYFDAANLVRTVAELKTSDVDLVFNVSEPTVAMPSLMSHAASLLDMMRIPYTGSTALTLSLCQDKINVKKLLSYHNIPTPRWDYAYSMDDEISQDLRYPLIVKPGNMDHSIGITNDSVVTNKEQLYRQLHKIIVDYKVPALIEEYIEGDEYNVSILGTDENDYQVLPLSRSIFKNLPEGLWHIYTHEAKIGSNPAYDSIIVQHPAKNINKKLEALITEIALDTYSILDCRDYGRVEIRVDKDNNPYVLELNPNPSLSPGTILPESAKLMQMNYSELLDDIINSAIRRYKHQPSDFSPPGRNT